MLFHPLINYGFPPVFTPTSSCSPIPPYVPPFTPPLHTFSYGSSVPSFTSPTPPQSVFWVCKLNNRITTCYGCRAKFTRAADGGVPVPPLDLILKCTENREYYDKDGNKQEKENANTYYHPSISCVKLKHPHFQPISDVRIADSLRSVLLPAHYELLQSVFNVS